MARAAWGFLGGYLLFFTGWVAGIVAAVVSRDGPTGPYGADYEPVAVGLAAAGVLLFVVGVQVVARARWGGISAHPEAMVIFLMTPLPALVAVGLNLIGRHFRRSDGMVLRVLLIGGGVYLAATTAMELANGLPRPAGPDDLKMLLWPFTLQAGFGLALLGLHPPARTEAAPEPEAVAA